MAVEKPARDPRHAHYTGTMSDTKGAFPIALDVYYNDEHDITRAVYHNVRIGSNEKMTCTYSYGGNIVLSGKISGRTFTLDLHEYGEGHLTGEGREGDKVLQVNLNED